MSWKATELRDWWRSFRQKNGRKLLEMIFLDISDKITQLLGEAVDESRRRHRACVQVTAVWTFIVTSDYDVANQEFQVLLTS